MRLSWRIALAGALILAAAGSWLGWRMAGDLHIRQQQSAEVVLVDLAQILAAVAAGSDSEPDTQALAKAWAAASASPMQADIYDLRKTGLQLEAVLTDRHGIVRWHSASAAAIGQDWSRWNDIRRTLLGRYGARGTRSDPANPRTAVMHVAAPVLRQGALIGVLSVAIPVASWSSLYGDGVAQGWRLALVTVGAAAILLLLAAWWITAPLQRLERWVAAAARERRSPPAGPPEITRLGKAFARMRDDLADREGLERHMQQLTHELKSPLTAITAGAVLLMDPRLPESERQRLLDHMQRESARSADLADRLLQLAQLARLPAPTRETVEVPALIHDIVLALRPLADRRRITLAVHAEEPVTVVGDGWWLGQALRNLLDNAILHSPEGGGVRIDLQVETDALVLAVADRGAGVPVWLRERLGERFAAGPRPDGSRGTGLGLALVEAVMRLHGGSWTCADRPGGGTVASLRLPRTPPR